MAHDLAYPCCFPRVSKWRGVSDDGGRMEFCGLVCSGVSKRGNLAMNSKQIHRFRSSVAKEKDCSLVASCASPLAPDLVPQPLEAESADIK